MKIAKTAMLLIPVLFAGAANAESPTAWPRYPYFGIEANEPATAVKTTPSTYNVWDDIFVPFGSSAAATGADKGGQSPTSAADLDKLQRSYKDYWLHRHQELTAGNQWADVLPVRVHERLNGKAFGSPVMGAISNPREALQRNWQCRKSAEENTKFSSAKAASHAFSSMA